MADPATLGAARPLHDVVLRADGPLTLTATAVRHLTELGGTPYFSASSAGPGTLALSAPGENLLVAETAWARAAPAEDVGDEATAQAATGVMHVHGRRSGEPRGLAADYLSTASSVLTAQGLLAALIGRARGAAIASVRTGVDLAGLLTVSQYLAAATTEEDEAVPLTPGGPPFTSADGVTYEVETLDSGRVGGVLAHARRAGPGGVGGLAVLPVPVRHGLLPLPRGPARARRRPPRGTRYGQPPRGPAPLCARSVPCLSGPPNPARTCPGNCGLIGRSRRRDRIRTRPNRRICPSRWPASRSWRPGGASRRPSPPTCWACSAPR